jgi:peptide/nickel transport system ATP-binding protein
LAVRSFKKGKGDKGVKRDVVLEVEDVTASYGGPDNVLTEIDLEIRRGRTVALVGESGSGKSTLARVITGLLPPTQGRVVFKGEELPAALKSRKREDLRRLQMIYQMPDTALNPRQKIRKIIGRPLAFYFNYNRKKQEARILELLDQIELPADYIDRYPTELSGGEKQRICIARALAAEPDLIICDEVTSALDQLVAEGILKLLLNLQRQLQVSYLFITHDLATVKAISDEIVVMLNGRIVEKGPKQEILKPPHHEYTDLLLSSVPEMDPDWLDELLEARAEQDDGTNPMMEPAA